MSKTLDNGMICDSEQSVDAVDDIYEEVKKELQYRGAYILNNEEAEKVAKIILVERGGVSAVNPAIVGQPAYKIAEIAGISVPKDAKVLIGEEKEVAVENPFAHEKLSPVLALYRAADFNDAFQKAHDLVLLFVAGHTSVLFTDESKIERIDKFAPTMPKVRLLINTLSSQSTTGAL